MKRTIQTIVFVLIATLVLTYPVMAQESNPTDTVSITIFAVLTAVFTSLMQSVGVGAALSFLNQLGKIWAPKYFPDGSSGNWRLAAILVLTVVIVFGPGLAIVVTVCNSLILKGVGAGFCSNKVMIGKHSHQRSFPIFS